MRIRPETPADFASIRAINIAAFADHPYSQQTEHLIVEALRLADALALSLVAEDGAEVVGHVAFSAAKIGETLGEWYLLGPIAVCLDRQCEGIGSALVEAGIGKLRELDATGVVLVGDPGYYARFGFRQVAGVSCEGVPDENVLVLPLADVVPAGEVTHHPAFFVQS